MTTVIVHDINGDVCLQSQENLHSYSKIDVHLADLELCTDDKIMEGVIDRYRESYPHLIVYSDDTRDDMIEGSTIALYVAHAFKNDSDSHHADLYVLFCSHKANGISASVVYDYIVRYMEMYERMI